MKKFLLLLAVIGLTSCASMPKPAWVSWTRGYIPKQLCDQYVDSLSSQHFPVNSQTRTQCMNLVKPAFEKCVAEKYKSFPNSFGQWSSNRWGKRIIVCIKTRVIDAQKLPILTREEIQQKVLPMFVNIVSKTCATRAVDYLNSSVKTPESCRKVIASHQKSCSMKTLKGQPDKIQGINRLKMLAKTQALCLMDNSFNLPENIHQKLIKELNAM